MVAEAKRFNAELVASGRAEFHCCNAERMPFGDASFDRAFSIGVIHFWSDPVALLKELRRVLERGGVALMGALAPPAAPDFAKAEFGFFLRDPAAWEAHCWEAGFAEVKTEAFEFAQAGPNGAAIKRSAVASESVPDCSFLHPARAKRKARKERARMRARGAACSRPAPPL